MADTSTFPDPLDYDATRKELERKRRIAEALAASPAPEGQWIRGSRNQPIYIPVGAGEYLGAAANQIAGKLDLAKISQQEAALQQQEADDRNLWVNNIPQDGGSAARAQHLVSGMNLPSLRQTLLAQLGQELDRPAKAEAEQARAAQAQAAQQAQDARQQAAFHQQDQLLAQRFANQLTLKGMGAPGRASGPTGASVSPAPGNVPAAPDFAGHATQVAVDPNTNMPVFRVNKTGRMFTLDPNTGEPKPLSGPIAPKGSDRLDAATKKAVTEAGIGIANIDAAQALLRSPDAKNSLGLQYAVPGAERIGQVADPKGVPVRAAVANIGSQKLHDRSGAAVTISEFPRLRPFIPSVSDTPQAAAAKLDQLKAEYQRMQAEWRKGWNTDRLGGRAAVNNPPLRQTVEAAAAPTPQVRRYNPATGRLE